MKRGSRGGEVRPRWTGSQVTFSEARQLAMRRCEEEADGGLQGGEIQKEGGSQAEDQDPGSSEGNGSEQETVKIEQV